MRKSALITNPAPALLLRELQFRWSPQAGRGDFCEAKISGMIQLRGRRWLYSMQHTRPVSQPTYTALQDSRHTRQENETRAPRVHPGVGHVRIHNKSGGSAFWLCQQRPQQLVLVTSFCSRKTAADSPNAFLPAKSHSSGGDYFYIYIQQQHSQLEYSCSRRGARFIGQSCRQMSYCCLNPQLVCFMILNF